MQTQAEFVKLDWTDDRSLRYTTKDNHIGVTSVKQTIQSLQFTDMCRDSLSYFEDIKKQIAIWSFQQREKIYKAFLTLQNKGFLFLVITKSNVFDDDFEDKLSELDISIASRKDSSIITSNLSVQALPNCDEAQYKSFLNPAMTLECKLPNAGN
jgi:hypothetical protein